MSKQQIIFLMPADAIRLHDQIIKRFGGGSGVRDMKLLESAIHQPQMIIFNEYIYQDIFEMAAAYAYHLIKNHPFVDGNKRTGILITLTFLELNGHLIQADKEYLYNLGLDIASSKLTKEEIAASLKSHSLQVKS